MVKGLVSFSFRVLLSKMERSQIAATWVFLFYEISDGYVQFNSVGEERGSGDIISPFAGNECFRLFFENVESMTCCLFSSRLSFILVATMATSTSFLLSAPRSSCTQVSRNRVGINRTETHVLSQIRLFGLDQSSCSLSPQSIRSEQWHQEGCERDLSINFQDHNHLFPIKGPTVIFFSYQFYKTSLFLHLMNQSSATAKYYCFLILVINLKLQIIGIFT